MIKGKNRVHSLPVSQSLDHVVELGYVGGKYYILVDGGLVYTSATTSERPSVLWFGNPYDTGSNGRWTSLDIDQISVTALAP